METYNPLIKIDFYDCVLKRELPAAVVWESYFLEYMNDFKSHNSLKVDVIYIVSSSELLILFNQQMEEERFIGFIQSLYPEASIELIAQGCIGFMSAVNNFYFSSYQKGLFVLLENHFETQQHILNATGVGTFNNKEGFVNQVGFGVISLTKVVKGLKFDDALVISCSNILIQEKNISGLRKFVMEIANQLKVLNAAIQSKIISFEVVNKYSEILVKGLNLSLPHEIKPDKWLKSLEKDTTNHYLTLKPIIELKLYEELINKNGITIQQIAVGGRIGIMNIKRLSSDDYCENYFPTYLNCQEFDFKDDLPAYEAIYQMYLNLNGDPNRMEVFYESINQTSKSMNYLSNEYYQWHIK